jgi:acetylornithine deacetylase/succinyl-diaminopimelate desuccinylase-like protein
MALDVVDLLSDLVRIPSVNPMGRAASGDIYYEHRVTGHLEGLFRGLGLPVERHTVAPLRDNIVTRVEGDVPPERGGKIVMLEAHQDTVPVEGMTVEPFRPKIENGRLYGRGSCDIKGGMAAMITAVARLAKEKPPGRPTVVMACTINEEHGFTGASHWAATYFGRPPDSGHGPEPIPPAGRSELLPRVPDAAIVAEPTKLNVVVAHKGAARWRCSTRGVATHSSHYIQSKLGPNAPVVHEKPFMLTRGLLDKNNGALAERLGGVIRKHGGPGATIGVPFGTDAPHFAATGCPTVVFGPGSIDQAHTADEWIEIEQLRAAAEIVYDFCTSA